MMSRRRRVFGTRAGNCSAGVFICALSRSLTGASRLAAWWGSKSYRSGGQHVKVPDRGAGLKNCCYSRESGQLPPPTST
jgi:hypothetical protein